jgi:2-polyprenyl-6-methoxyphenol hydroxylase-like FAD-dependent oxidoreductase
MQVAVIGAGIGGLTLARALTRRSIDVTIYERRDRYARTGLGLLLLPNGMAALDALGLGDEIRALSNPLDLAVIRSIKGRSLVQFPLEGHRGIARLDLLNRLQAGVEPSCVRWESSFQSLSSTDPAEATVGGEVIRPDLLVGADGARSTMRPFVAPDFRLKQCMVSELVSVCDAPDLAALYDRTFIKHVSPAERLAVGLVPAAYGKIVWFLQFDAGARGPLPSDPVGKRAFVEDLVGSWARPVQDLVERTDFVHTHLWRTPAPGPCAPLVTGRVVLIGDAAHPFPTLTSQGANAAMVDATVLARHLDSADSIEEALRAFVAERTPRIEEITRGGQQLVDTFVEGGAPGRLPLVH